MPQDSASRHLDQFMVRFPDGMRDQLKALAAQSNRSLNAEIIARLQSTLDGSTTEISEEERSRIVISTTIQIMVGLRSAIAEIPKDEREDIEELLDIAFDDLVSRMTKSGVKT